MFTTQFEIVKGPSVFDLLVSLCHQDRVDVGVGDHLVSFCIPMISTKAGSANAVHVWITEMTRQNHLCTQWRLGAVVGHSCSRSLISILDINGSDVSLNHATHLYQSTLSFYMVAYYDSEKRIGRMTLTI